MGKKFKGDATIILSSHPSSFLRQFQIQSIFSSLNELVLKREAS